MDAEAVVAGLDASQRRAVTSSARSLRILAGAGSGKTRVLTRRIAYRAATGDAQPDRVLALTFTRKAARELTVRLEALGLRDQPTAGTFHAVAYAQLRARWAGSSRRPPALLDRKIPFLARSLTSGEAPRDRHGLAELAREIEWAKARRVSPTAYPQAATEARRRTARPAQEVGALYARYEDEKHHRGVLDFDDLLGQLITALDHDPDFARAQRWRFRHLYVDEFQDVNPLQFELLRRWLGDRDDLCVVGDPNQAIYRWNGADATYLNEIEGWLPGAETVELTGNYRSSPQILAAATAILGAGDARGTDPAERAVAHRPDGLEPVVVSYPSDAAEAAGVARAVRDHHLPGRSWSSQAVLVRTNAQIGLIEEAMRRAAIPHRVRGSSGTLAAAPVKEVLRGLRRSTVPFATWLTDVEAGTIGAGGEAAGQPDADDPLAQLISLGHAFATAEPGAPAAAFPGWLTATLGSESVDDNADVVELVTFHAAKGLEWPVVHVAGLEDGLVPIGHADTAADRAEERRLLYVAVTRAEQVLSLSWAQARSLGGRVIARSASPWLPTAAVAPGPEMLTSGRFQEHVAASREALAVSARPRVVHTAWSVDGEPDAQRSALLHALRAWRCRIARDARAPDAVVLADRTLHELARRRPASVEALAAIPGVGPIKARRYGATLLGILCPPSEATSTTG